MRLPLALLLALICCSLLLACGGRSARGVPPGARKDGGAPPQEETGPPTDTWWPKDKPLPKDVWYPKDTWWPKDKPTLNDDNIPPTCKKMGNTCMSSSACCPGLSCTSLSTGVQICTKQCTPDDPQTPLVNEDTCPYTHLCGNISSPGSGYRCLQKCEPKLNSITCPTGLACHPLSAKFGGSMDKAVCIYPPCKSGKDCPVLLSETCNMATTVPKCTTMPKGAFCSPESQGAPTGRCALAGECNPVSGLCGVHKYGKSTAKVGDPCKDDRDCGGQMSCLQEEAAMGQTQYRNGYCVIPGCTFANTLTHRACTSGSTCSILTYGGFCFKSCDLTQASTCRGHANDKHGDYECRAWNNLTFSGKPISKIPVCEPGHWAQCNLFGTTKLDCSSLGVYNKGNPTKMSCRDPKSGKVLPNKQDPSGYCLDNTASGKTY